MGFNHILAINTLITVVVIGNAFVLKKQFYPSVVYITNSKPTLAYFLATFWTRNMKFETDITLNGKERVKTLIIYIREQIWPTFMDSCFAFAVFHKSGDNMFYFRLLCLFVFKMIHFMAQLRVNLMSMVVQLPQHFHFRVNGLLLYLCLVNVIQISISLKRLKKSGLSIEVLYLFEYSMLLLTVIHIKCQYILEVIDRLREGEGWEEKVVYSNYFDLIFISCKTLLNLVVFGLLLKMKVLPIFMMRTIANNIRKLKDCFWRAVMSRRAIARIAQFPNPKPEDLIADNMCAICRDEIKEAVLAKKLFCKHIFHISCLKDWMRRQQTCPTCRSDVITTREPVHRQPAQEPAEGEVVDEAEEDNERQQDVN